MQLRGLIVSLSVCALLLTACSGAPPERGTTIVPAPSAALHGDPNSPAIGTGGGALPSPSPDGQAAVPSKDGTAARAYAENAEGKLVIRPTGPVTEEKLGAPSCLGQENDHQWKGSFEAVWQPKVGTEQPVALYEDGFDGDGIIQPDTEPVRMAAVSLGSADLYAFTPQYTDCHALLTYFYVLEGGKAYSVPLVFGEEQTKPLMARLPIGGMETKDGELLLAEGYGAGQDKIDVYHFRYNAASRQLERTATDSHDAARFLEQAKGTAK